MYSDWYTLTCISVLLPWIFTVTTLTILSCLFVLQYTVVFLAGYHVVMAIQAQAKGCDVP